MRCFITALYPIGFFLVLFKMSVFFYEFQCNVTMRRRSVRFVDKAVIVFTKADLKKDVALRRLRVRLVKANLVSEGSDFYPAWSQL